MTVKQFKDLADYDELRSWQLFEEKYGLLHAPVRFEQAIARAVVPFLKDAKIEDFAPWPKMEEKVATIEDVFGLMKAAARAGKKVKKAVKKAFGRKKKVTDSG